MHRGYEEDANDDGDEKMKLDDNESVSSLEKPKDTRKRAESNSSGIQKYTKPLREAHSKYLQYLKDINFNEDKNIASINVAFPLSFKKVLMLTLAEQTLEKVLVRSIPNIEKCTLVKPKNESEEPFLIVQGINFDAFYPYFYIIDVDRIETNHSYALKSKYGVEAMRANIMKEV